MTYDVDQATALLRRTPAVLSALLHGLPPEWLDAPERPGAWSAREVAYHVADLEHDAWIGRARTIVAHGADVPLAAVVRERFRERYADTALDAVLEDFRRLRSANLETLRALQVDADTLARRGTHSALGAVTLAELLSTWVVHDLTHIAQITRALAAQYSAAVGPWREYLSVLRAP